MKTILDAEWLTLTGTLTFGVRKVYWCPGASLTHLDADMDSHAVKMHQQTREGNKIYEDEYTVQYHGRIKGTEIHQFVWENRNPNPKPKPGEKVGPYMVSVGPGVFDCDCMATWCRKPVCKHRSASCRAIFMGMIDGAEPWAGIPEGHPEFRDIVPAEVWGAEEEVASSDPLGLDAIGDDMLASGLAFEDTPGEMTRSELDRQARELGWARAEPLEV